MKTYNIFSQHIAELLGSMFLVMAAISPIILFYHIIQTDLAIAVLADAVAVAFILSTLIEIFGPISGAHFNPAVTISMLLLKRITTTKAASYIIVQILGGIVGMLASHLMFYQDIPTLISVSTITRSGGAYLAEIFGTFILVFSILLLVKHQSKKLPQTIGMLVGGMLIATSSTMFANPQVTIARIFTYSAAGINPLDAAVFIVMEIIGVLFALLCFKLIEKEKKNAGKKTLSMDEGQGN